MIYKQRTYLSLNSDGDCEHGAPVAVGHEACRLGRWYRGDGKALFGTLPAYGKLEAPHALVHDSAHRVLALLEKVTVKGMAHITGGGLTENVPRVLPENTVAEIQKAAWPRPKLFDWMQKEGNVDEKEMHRTFNCGIGLVIVVAAADADAAMAELKAQGEAVYNIGVIRARQGDEAQTVVV